MNKYITAYKVVISIIFGLLGFVVNFYFSFFSALYSNHFNRIAVSNAHNSDLRLEVWVTVSIGWWLSIHETIGYTDNIYLSDWFLLAYPDKNYRKWVIEKWNADIEKALREGRENEYFQDVTI